ncbi:MAG: NAD(P)-dependent oxidoreductase [Gammaproteobacteria bacterium]|nr:NAD(P)-dependent oxidoreductase [Gammaproteobacteria bacterium]
MPTIGFIGTGTIGAPMALKLLEHEHTMLVFDIDSNATKAHVEQGARVAATVAEIAKACATVFLSLPGPAEIEEVVLGDDGLINHAETLATIADLSTNSLSLNRRIADIARRKGIDYLDTPVSGGKIAARDGSLAVMVGGDEAAFDEIRPLIECFGEHIFYMGPSGAGTLTKLVNNQIFLCASVLIQEGFVMAAKAGMDPSALLKVLKVSSAGPLMTRAPLVLSRKFDLDVFALSIATKDVGVALESARAVGASMPITEAAHAVYEDALEKGFGNEDFFATVKVLENAAGVELAPLRKPKEG